MKELEKEAGTRKKDLEETRDKLDKTGMDLGKKISHLESERKILNDNLNMKQQEIEKFKAELSENLKMPSEPTLKKVKSNSSLTSPQKREEEHAYFIEREKNNNKRQIKSYYSKRYEKNQKMFV